MNTRDRIVVVLTTTTVAAAFLGALLLWGIGVALLVVAGATGAVAVLVAQSPVEVVDIAVPVEAEVIEGEAPPFGEAAVRNPFRNRTASLG